MRFPAAIVALLVAAAAASKPEIRVEGQHAFSARRVESIVEPPEQVRDWQESDWENWSDQATFLLAEAYHEEGYFDARAEVATPAADSTARKRPIVSIRIFEGPRYRFGAVAVHLPGTGFPAYASSDLRCRSGRLFDQASVYRDKRDLLRFYGDAGFLKVQESDSLFYDTVHKAVDVTFRMEPGRALVFDTLLLRVQREGDTTGQTGKTSPGLLRRLFPLRRGDTLSLNQMSGFERKLKSTRAYNFVRLRDSLQGGEGRSALLLNAEEKIPGELEASGFWENLYGFGGSLDWSHANMGGHLQEGHATGTLAQRKQALFLGYGAPLLFGSSIRFDNDFFVNWYQDVDPVKDIGWFRGNFEVLNQSKLSRQLLQWLRVLSSAELHGKSTQSSAGRQRDFNLNYVNSVFLEELDNPLNPTQGARMALTWGNGGSFVRNGEIAVFQNRHNWLEAQDAAYLPVSRWLLAALRLDGGRFFGHGGLNSELFYLGGPRSVRSEDWRHVCPEIVDTICYDDIEPAYFLGSAELRLQPFQPPWISPDGKLHYLLPLQIVPFADYGNVWEVGKNLTPTGQGRAVGLGLRYVFLSLFNVRLDYAWDPRTGWDPRDATQSRLILDLSQAF